VNPRLLSTSIRKGTLLMLALTVFIGAFAVRATHELGGSIREALHRNYLSIEAAQQMHAALYAAELNRYQDHVPPFWGKAVPLLRIGSKLN
jgi:hypothetical protein